MRSLSNTDFWKGEFGLLPIKINPLDGLNRFLMLNGGSGDFCLQTDENEESETSFYENSWSTNTKNYVVVGNNKVKVFNWLNKSSEEVELDKAEKSKEKFYKYLVSKSYKTENDVVPFIIDIFRQLRNYTQEKKNPSVAINILYQLLISIEEDVAQIKFNDWKIENIKLPGEFENYSERLKNGVKGIKPKLDLILRHSSGALFQEAHREVVYFDSQLDLFNGISNNISTKKDSYSSVHYTPQYLARSIVENCLKYLDMGKPRFKIFDPACGSSEFLIEALKQLKNLGYDGQVRVVGWDTSESAINTSKFLLQYEKKKQWNNKLEFEVKKVEDSLSESWENDYDLILMNPPFISWELLTDPKSKGALAVAFGSQLRMAKPNQASAFFYKSVMALNSDGVIGCVLPSSIFTFDSYKHLRNEINEQLSLKLLAKLGNFVFEDALTDVSFFIGQKPKKPFIPKLIWTKNDKGNAQEALREFRKMEANAELSKDEKGYSIYSPPLFPILPGTWRIISLKENKILKDLERFTFENSLSKTTDIFRVQQGIRQGVKDIFKISKFEYEKSNEKNLFRPVVDNKAIKNGMLFDYSFIWYPYDKNGILFSHEDELRDLDFYKTTLKPNELSLKNRQGIQEWWGLTRPRNWQYQKAPKLISTEFGKSDSFAFDKSGDFVVERGNGWIPKKEFSSEDYYFYLSVFSSSIFDTLLSIYSKSILSGFYLGQVYTSNIPIPNVHSILVKEHMAYKKLVYLGIELSNGNSYVKDAIDDVLKKSFYPMM